MWAVTKAVRAWWEKHGRPAQLCVALSGGADSLALTAGAVRTGAQVTALLVDHQLQEGSGQVAHHAAEQARQLGCVEALVIPIVINDENGLGMEGAAREARYAALDMMRAGRPVLLGHTQDDQAETLLLGLLRGSGSHAIAGMSDWDDPWGRPLLGLRRADTHAACAEHAIDVWNDPQNKDSAFTRVCVRHEVIPLLQEISGGEIVPALARTAQLVREDADELDSQADTILREALQRSDGSGELPLDSLRELPLPTLRRVLRLWLHAHGHTQAGYTHLQEVARLVTDWHGQGPIALPGGDIVKRQDKALYFVPVVPAADSASSALSMGCGHAHGCRHGH